MEKQAKPLEKFLTEFFLSVIRPQSYRNIFYLLFSFPLGIIYFIFAITGLSVGVGLIPVFLIGIPILMFVLSASKRIMLFERNLAEGYLNMKLPEYLPQSAPSNSFITRIKNEVTDPLSWRSILFIFIKFQLGIFNFTSVVTLFSLSLGFLAAPIVYLAAGHELETEVFHISVFFAPDMSNGAVAGIYAVIGFLLLFVSVYLSKLLARLNGKIVGLMYEKW